MARRSRGLRSRSRDKLAGGRFSIAEALQDFKPGETVVLKLNPAVHKGMPHHRYSGKQGTVVEKRGRSFVVEILDHNKKKFQISRPEHLKKY